MTAIRYASCVTFGAILFLLSGCRSPQSATTPSIEFTTVPQANPGGPAGIEEIEGRAIGAKAGQRIVLFAKSGTWWVQPTSGKPFTAIAQDSTWKSSTHLGTEYAAILVESGYVPPKTTDVLPRKG